MKYLSSIKDRDNSFILPSFNINDQQENLITDYDDGLNP